MKKYPKVVFKFDKEKDLWNIWLKCNTNSKFGDFEKNIPPKIIKIIKGKEFEECKKELLKLRKKTYTSSLFPVVVNSFNKAWNIINDEYFKRLEKIMKKQICSGKFTAYLSTMGAHSYNYNIKSPFFMVGFFGGIPSALEMAGHEIMHIQFHNAYWKEVEKKIGFDKTNDLKESLTILLDLEFKDLWLIKDKGYDSHKELREFISKEWKKKKDFDILLDKCVKYLKKMKK